MKFFARMPSRSNSVCPTMNVMKFTHFLAELKWGVEVGNCEVLLEEIDKATGAYKYVCALAFAFITD